MKCAASRLVSKGAVPGVSVRPFIHTGTEHAHNSFRGRMSKSFTTLRQETRSRNAEIQRDKTVFAWSWTPDCRLSSDGGHGGHVTSPW
jgi:hypothetical protein